MHHQEPLTIVLEPSPLECWDDESTASALRTLAVRLHSTGISLRETTAVLETFGVTRSHQAVFQWVHRIGNEAPDPPTAKPSPERPAFWLANESFALVNIAESLLTKLLQRWH